MTTQWRQVDSRDAGVNRYQAENRRAQAWVKRNADGSAEYGAKNGLFGLGLHSEGYHVAPAPGDEVLLEKLDESANPPRFTGWVKEDRTSPGTTYYQGQADNLLSSKVKASITRVGDEASVQAKVGLFGTEIEGHYFAPAPSDAQILKSISRRS
jgi:hypothetical protein